MMTSALAITRPGWDVGSLRIGSAVPVPVPYANLNNPQTLNLYAMVHDNPETFADLNGHLAAATGQQADPPGDTSTQGSNPDTQQQNRNQAGQPLQQEQPNSPDLQQQAAQASAQKIQEAKSSGDAPPVGSPEYIAKVADQVSTAATAESKYILAPAAGLEAAGLAAVAIPEAGAVADATQSFAAARPSQAVQFAQGFIAAATPGATAPPPTLSGVVGYAAGKLASWLGGKL
jgi:hypothetical protein